MGTDLVPVTFHFAHETGSTDTEIHYVVEPPVVGDLMTHGHEPWVVRSVESDAVGLVAVCRGPLETRPPTDEEGRSVVRSL